MIEARIDSVSRDVEVQVERGVLAVAQLDHARHAHEIDARAEVEAADDRRARKDQHRELLVALDQRVRDRAAAAQVAEAERVVAVDQYAAVAPASTLMTPPPSRSTILGDLSGRGKPCRPRTAAAEPAGLSALGRPPAGPGQRRGARAAARSQTPTWSRSYTGIDPLHLGLAELARAIARVHRIEHPPLARRAVLDVGVARERCRPRCGCSPACRSPPGRRRTRSTGSRSGSPPGRGNRGPTPSSGKAGSACGTTRRSPRPRAARPVAALLVGHVDVVHAQLARRSRRAASPAWRCCRGRRRTSRAWSRERF